MHGFLEASFLVLMLFGWKRVGASLRTLPFVLVAIGTTMSRFWILAANSWIQTRDGYVLKDGHRLSGQLAARDLIRLGRATQLP